MILRSLSGSWINLPKIRISIPTEFRDCSMYNTNSLMSDFYVPLIPRDLLESRRDAVPWLMEKSWVRFYVELSLTKF